ncbi:hypothetical protein F5878DRAFT_549399, partial [Lentinula raphanica]
MNTTHFRAIKRKHDVCEESRFVWPHFTMEERSSPRAPWAPPASISDPNADIQYVQLLDPERRAAMQELAIAMNYESAVRVGHIHRFLCQSLENQDKLQKNLETTTLHALKYVCLDIN